MALIPPFFLDCVTAIGYRNDRGDVQIGATGFLYGRLVETNDPSTKIYRIYLVTNRHVFEHQTAAVLRFNPSAAEPARFYDLPLNDDKGLPRWSVHPNPEIDSAAIPVASQHLKKEDIQFSWFRDDEHVMTHTIARDEGLSEGDGLFVLGFPLGDVGGERNYVIVRHGVVARVRDMLAGTSNVMLVDSTVFPGNSGGPVISRPEAVSIVN